jgi:hypothetical protein
MAPIGVSHASRHIPFTIFQFQGRIYLGKYKELGQK